MNWNQIPPCREESLRQTVRLSREAFLEGEGSRPLSRWEFLAWQLRYIRKHWWLLQAGLLALLWWLLRAGSGSARRTLGVGGPLFVLLALPELWKNRACNALEVESAALYSLRQIYAARLTLFAGADVVLVSLFFLCAPPSPWALLADFLLPAAVSCCICLRCLYSRCPEGLCLVLCGVWTAFWETIVLRDRFYQAISPGVWLGLLALTGLWLVRCVARGQKEYETIWEVRPLWN